MKQSLYKSILIFILLHLFAGLAWTRPAPEIKDGLLYYTDRFGARTSIPIEDIQNIHHEVYQIPVPENASAELQEQIRLKNLENTWLKGRHFIRVGRELVEIDLAQSIEIVRARQMKDQPLHPNTYLTDEERSHLNMRLNEVRQALQDQKKEMESQIPKAEKKIATTDVVAQAVNKNGSVWTLLLDGLPYFLNNLNGNTLLTYGSKTMEVRSQEVLACNLPTSPPTGNNLKLKLNGDTRSYYSNLASGITLDPSPAMRIVTMNTTTGNAFCTTGPSDRIFSSGFESSGVQ